MWVATSRAYGHRHTVAAPDGATSNATMSHGVQAAASAKCHGDINVYLHFQMKKLLVAALVAAFISGCASVHPTTVPYVASPPSLPKDQTAVVISMDRQSTPPFLAVIRSIDGQQVQCHWNYGCPVWARVGPGTHQLWVRYETAMTLTSTGTSNTAELKYKDLQVTVPDMKPTHVYVIHYPWTSGIGSVSAQVTDLGERPHSGILFPFGVSNATEYFADF